MLNSDIHPDLRREALIIRGVGIFLSVFLTIGVPLAILIPIISEIRKGRIAEVTAVALLGMAAFVFLFSLWMSRSFFSYYLGMLRQASWLLTNTFPRRVKITVFILSGRKGMGAELREEDAAETSEPYEVITLESIRPIPLKPGMTNVRVYQDDSDPGGLRVLQTEQSVLMGMTLSGAFQLSRAQMHRKLMSIVLWLVGAGIVSIVVILGFMIGGFYQTMQQAIASKSWPVAQGRTFVSQVRETKIPKGKSSAPGYRAVLEYEYTVNGKTYRSNLIHFNYRATEKREEALRFVERYPEGSLLPVYYDPQNPMTAVVEPGHEEELYKEMQVMVLVIGLLILVFIILLIGIVVARKRFDAEARNGVRLDGIQKKRGLFQWNG